MIRSWSGVSAGCMADATGFGGRTIGGYETDSRRFLASRGEAGGELMVGPFSASPAGAWAVSSSIISTTASSTRCSKPLTNLTIADRLSVSLASSSLIRFFDLSEFHVKFPTTSTMNVGMRIGSEM